MGLTYSDTVDTGEALISTVLRLLYLNQRTDPKMTEPKMIKTGRMMTGSFHDNSSASSWSFNSPAFFVGSETAGAGVRVTCVFTSVILEGDVSVDEEEVGDSGPVSIQKIEVNCLYLPSVVFKSSKGSGVE